MGYIAERIPIGPRIVIADSLSKFSAAQAKALADLGIAGIVRVIETASADEIEWLTEAGLGVMWYQEARIDGVSAMTGDRDGMQAREDARRCGFLDDVTGWCDRESVHIVPGRDLEIAYQNAWWTACGADPGVYRGAGINLDGDGWWHVHFRHYWRSFSAVPNVSHRSDQMVQLYPPDIVLAPDLPPVDLSAVQSDYFGDRPVWMKRG